MLRPRIIPCLLVHQGGLVKTQRFGSPKYVGDPINAVKIFNEKESDELIVLDIDASVKSAEPNYELIDKLAQECRMPLCYGGGIKTAQQAARIRQGALGPLQRGQEGGSRRRQARQRAERLAQAHQRRCIAGRGCPRRALPLTSGLGPISLE